MCIEIILDKDAFIQEEIHTRIGVSPQQLRRVADAFSHLMLSDINENELKARYNVSLRDVVLAVHSSLNDVGRGIKNIDVTGVGARYGISRQDVWTVFDKWEAIEDQIYPDGCRN